MTRNEEGGCRPLFQGISNVLKNEPKLRPCPFCGKTPELCCDDTMVKHKECFKGIVFDIEFWNTRSYDSALNDIEVYADNIGHVVDFLKGKCQR